ncbi:Uncharacterised protein [Mycobacteroides abscessus subsp. massiliense]|nr:Uncharacterised protein [Mycobacteroides abscessus subsp. massiliense]
MRSSWETGKTVAPHTIPSTIAIEDGSNAFFIEAVGFGLRVVGASSQTDFHAGYAQEFAVRFAEPITLLNISLHAQTGSVGSQ